MSPRRKAARRRGFRPRRGNPAFRAEALARQGHTVKKTVWLSFLTWLGGWRFLGVRPTGQGARLLFLLAVMGFAAFNTRNNLLYLMFSVGLAGIVVSVVSGWLSLRGLELETELADDLYADTPAEERFRLRNGSRVFAVYGIQLVDIDFPGPSPRAAVTYLPAGEATALRIEKTYPRRGRFDGARMRLQTAYPFGLFETIRDIPVRRRFTVFPCVSKVDISFAFQGRAGSVPLRQRRGESEELLRLRDYTAGDNLHHIHWRSTAKLGRLMTRVFAAQQKRRFSIVFDHSVGEGEKVGPDAFEVMVSAAASMASHLAAHGLSFSFASPDDVFPHDASREHLRGVLGYLAVVMPRPATQPAQNLEGWVEDAVRSGDTVLLLRYSAAGVREKPSTPQLHVIDPDAVFSEEHRVGV